jgi:hypothetical protein
MIATVLLIKIRSDAYDSSSKSLKGEEGGREGVASSSEME